MHNFKYHTHDNILQNLNTANSVAQIQQEDSSTYNTIIQQHVALERNSAGNIKILMMMTLASVIN